jgi:hypothetical protein
MAGTNVGKCLYMALKLGNGQLFHFFGDARAYL